VSSGHPTSGDEAAAIKADIEQARAELAGTADALAARLDVKNNVKTAAHRKVQGAGERVSSAYESAKGATPEPVQQAWARAESAAQPVVAKAGEDKKRTALIVAGVLAVVLVARRIAARRSEG
jgi:hypothetical protein